MLICKVVELHYSNAQFSFVLINDKVKVIRHSYDAWVVLPNRLHFLCRLPPNDRDYTTHTDYGHFKPVNHDYLTQMLEWLYFSTFQPDVAEEMYPSRWYGGQNDAAAAGERD